MRSGLRQSDRATGLPERVAVCFADTGITTDGRAADPRAGNLPGPSP